MAAWPMPTRGERRLRSTSTARAFIGEMYSTRQRLSRSSGTGSAASRSRAHRKAESVLPGAGRCHHQGVVARPDGVPRTHLRLRGLAEGAAEPGGRGGGEAVEHVGGAAVGAAAGTGHRAKPATAHRQPRGSGPPVDAVGRGGFAHLHGGPVASPPSMSRHLGAAPGSWSPRGRPRRRRRWPAPCRARRSRHRRPHLRAGCRPRRASRPVPDPLDQRARRPLEEHRPDHRVDAPCAQTADHPDRHDDPERRAQGKGEESGSPGEGEADEVGPAPREPTGAATPPRLETAEAMPNVMPRKPAPRAPCSRCCAATPAAGPIERRIEQVGRRDHHDDGLKERLAPDVAGPSRASAAYPLNPPRPPGRPASPAILAGLGAVALDDRRAGGGRRPRSGRRSRPPRRRR